MKHLLPVHPDEGAGQGGSATCFGDAKGRRKPPGRPVSKTRLADGRRPTPHPHPPRTPSPSFHPWVPVPPPAPRALSRPCHPGSQPTLRTSGSVAGPSQAGRVPALRGGPGPGGRRTPTLAAAWRRKTTRRRLRAEAGGGGGSLAGGRGAVPRRSGDGTPPWWRVVSCGAERWAGGDPRPRTGLLGDSAPMRVSGRPP